MPTPFPWQDGHKFSFLEAKRLVCQTLKRRTTLFNLPRFLMLLTKEKSSHLRGTITRRRTAIHSLLGSKRTAHTALLLARTLERLICSARSLPVHGKRSRLSSESFLKLI
ncbi:hypothetical protein [Circoviridae sp.]|nr:hypothetical protein [Circoviridae sp.]